MALSRVKNWIAEVLTFNDLNAEFNNILNNATSLISPATASWDMNGFEFILDADADTSITADTDDQIDVRIGGTDHIRATASGLGITAANKLYFDGVAMSGDTYIVESSANTLDGVAGGNTMLRITASSVTVAGQLLFTDATYDIGASGATRPRNIFLSADAHIGVNARVGGSATRSGTAGTNRVDIFDGTAPTGTLANGVSLYSTAGKLFAMDSAGVATQLTP